MSFGETVHLNGLPSTMDSPHAKQGRAHKSKARENADNDAHAARFGQLVHLGIGEVDLGGSHRDGAGDRCSRRLAR